MQDTAKTGSADAETPFEKSVIHLIGRRGEVLSPSQGIQIIGDRIEPLILGNSVEAVSFLNTLRELPDAEVAKYTQTQYCGIIFGLLKGAASLTAVHSETATVFETALPAAVADLLVKANREKLTGKDLAYMTEALTSYAMSGRPGETEMKGRGNDLREINRHFSEKGVTCISQFAFQFLRELAHKMVQRCSDYGISYNMKEFKSI